MDPNQNSVVYLADISHFYRAQNHPQVYILFSSAVLNWVLAGHVWGERCRQCDAELDRCVGRDSMPNALSRSLIRLIIAGKEKEFEWSHHIP